MGKDCTDPLLEIGVSLASKKPFAFTIFKDLSTKILIFRKLIDASSIKNRKRLVDVWSPRKPAGDEVNDLARKARNSSR